MAITNVAVWLLAWYYNYIKIKKCGKSKYNVYFFRQVPLCLHRRGGAVWWGTPPHSSDDAGNLTFFPTKGPVKNTIYFFIFAISDPFHGRQDSLHVQPDHIRRQPPKVSSFF